jgi:hypothetical protein
MSLTYTDSDIDSDSDCEEEYQTFCQDNVALHNFMINQVKIMSRVAKMERVVDDLSFQFERLIDELISAIKIIKQ